MDHELIHTEEDVDDLISDIHQLIDEEASAPAEEPAPEPPAEEAPAEDAPVEDAPTEEVPIEEAPAEDAPVEDAPAEEAPAVEKSPHWTDRQRVPKHVAKLQQNQEEAYAQWLKEQEEKGEEPPPVFKEELPKKKKKREKAEEPQEETDSAPVAVKMKKSRFAAWFCGILVLLTLAVVATAVFFVPGRPLADNAMLHSDGASAILLAGTDESLGRTDTLMLMTLNSSKNTVCLVSIPRDTAVLTEDGIVSIGSVYGRAGGGEAGMTALKEAVRDCVGFVPDGCLILYPQALTDFLEILGGETDGETAYALLSADGATVSDDLIRVQTQRNFLTQVMCRCQSASAVSKAPRLLDALCRNAVTDLDTRNFLWLARTALLADCANAEQSTLPGTAGEDGRYLLDAQLTVQNVNAYCNPYVRAVSVDDLRLVQQPVEE